MQTMTLKFFGATLVRTLHQILHLDLYIQYSLKITKSQELVKFNTAATNMFRKNMNIKYLFPS